MIELKEYGTWNKFFKFLWVFPHLSLEKKINTDFKRISSDKVYKYSSPVLVNVRILVNIYGIIYFS